VSRGICSATGLLLAVLTIGGRLISAQAPPAGAPQTPASPRAAAPIDLTGYWVSIVNEDWRWRMVTPDKGDYPGINLTPAGKTLADAWDPATDGSCKAYGAAGLLRMPTRLHVTWENDSILRIDSDAGQQTRRLHFAARPPSAARSLQGQSIARWERGLPPASGFGFPGPPVAGPGGALSVVTTHLTSGWLRRNGVPYSDQTIVNEYFDRFPGPDDSEWFVVTTIVRDPVYLLGTFTTSSHFRREPDGSKWAPVPCKSS
jgi:hypothetical protein